MITVKEKDLVQEMNRIQVSVSNISGKIILVRDGITDDVREISNALIGGDPRLVLRGLSESIAEIRGRFNRLYGHVEDLGVLRDEVAKLILEELKD